MTSIVLKRPLYPTITTMKNYDNIRSSIGKIVGFKVKSLSKVTTLYLTWNHQAFKDNPVEKRMLQDVTVKVQESTYSTLPNNIFDHQNKALFLEHFDKDVTFHKILGLEM